MELFSPSTPRVLLPEPDVMVFKLSMEDRRLSPFSAVILLLFPVAIIVLFPSFPLTVLFEPIIFMLSLPEPAWTFVLLF